MSAIQVNINSPEILLNSWIDMNVRIWFDRGFRNKSKIGKILLAHIFLLGDEHGKLIELLKWLKSVHAKEVFTKDGEDQGGIWLLEAIATLPFKDSDLSDEKLISKINAYVDKNYEVTKYELKLGSPVYIRD
jgi:hypothetical protein